MIEEARYEVVYIVYIIVCVSQAQPNHPTIRVVGAICYTKR